MVDKTSHPKNWGMTIEEEAEMYEEQLQDIIDNPGWYLDNFEGLREYRVSWKNYHHLPQSPTLPYRYEDNA